MAEFPTRREVVAGATAALWAGPSASRAAPPVDTIGALERRAGGRLGVFAIDCGSSRRLAWRADERFLMCSTFKALAVADVLRRVDARQESLGRRVRFSAAKLLEHAPTAEARLAEGFMSVGQLCQAAIEVSDNTAANLILSRIGGPDGLTRFVRSIGDPVTRIDRRELALNRPDGDKDTTSPRAMAESVRRILLGEVLKPASRERLEAWMVASTPGLNRIRAGIPPDWGAGDKAGTGDSQTNDVAILRPPGRSTLIVAAYYASSAGELASREAVLREVGSLVAAGMATAPQASARGKA